MTRCIVTTLLLTELGSNLCFGLLLPRVASISTTFKQYFLHLWLQIDVVTSAVSTVLSNCVVCQTGVSAVLRL